MGQESTCTVQIGGDRYEAKVLLETDHILIRGERRTKIPLSEMSDICAVGDILQFNALGKSISLHLGKNSTKWAAKILNPPSLMAKLGIKTGSIVRAMGEIPADFFAEIQAAGANISDKPGADFIFLFADSPIWLAAVPGARNAIHQSGAIWIVYPRGRKNIRESDVFAAGKSASLVDVKVASFSSTHTALKFVIPVVKRHS